MSLDCVVTFLEPVKSYVYDTVTNYVSYIRNYSQNIDSLKEKLDDLRSKKKDIDEKVKRGKDNGHEITEGAERWLEKVHGLIKDEKLKKLMTTDTEVTKIVCQVMAGEQMVMKKLVREDRDITKEFKMETEEEKKLEKQRNRECCSAIFICYYHSRYLLSKAAKSLVEDIQKLMVDNCLGELTKQKSAQDFKDVPIESVYLESREKLAQEIVKNLEDHGVNVVGVHGMGGSGKTKLVKQVANNKAIKQSFKSIVFAEISEAPNIKHIQDQIAQKLGMDDIPSDEQQRARMLYDRLTFDKKQESKDGADKKQESKDGADKGKDILIILDNLWKKLDLEAVGIPDQNSKESRCKLLLTSREEDVCKAMGVQNFHMVGVLHDNEPWDLFWKLSGKCDSDHEYKSMAEKLLKKCGRLPLAIVGTANALKGKDLSAWEHFANELEKPISSQDAGIHREAYSVLQTSYKLIENNLKKRFFLLACLFPPGSRIRVSDMMRFGIGLGLFQNVNNLTEAMELADEWANQLVSSSLLLADDKDGCVKNLKIHDVVRASIISFAPEEGHEIMVEAIPRWLWKESCRKYTAISLIPDRDHSLLNMIKLEKLEMLVLNHTQPADFPKKFFQGMNNLRVLSMSGMTFEPYLPSSLGKLETLRALFIEHCNLGDTRLIGNLENLLVLSLKGSQVRELSKNIGNLRSLCLLDLTDCSMLKRIPASLMTCLSKLEGFYVKNSFTGWNIDGTKSSEGASIAEFGSLNSLKVLELKLESICQLPTRDHVFVDSLDNFDIQIGSFELPATNVIYKRLLNLGSFNLDQMAEYDCLNVLLRKAECLQVSDGKGLKHLVPNFDLKKDGFRDLKHLRVQDCPDMQYVVGKTYGVMNSPIWFPKLESMKLSKLSALKTICAVDFYLLPVDIAPLLTYLCVRDCINLKFVFMEHATNQSLSYCYRNERKDTTLKFPHLKVVRLEAMRNLESLFREECSSSTGRQHLFPKKIEIPALEKLILDKVGVTQLWIETHNDPQAELYVSRFRKLKVIKIVDCHELESLCTPSVVAALVELEELEVEECSKMSQVISTEANGIHSPDNYNVLPNLKHLKLYNLPWVTCFYGGSSQSTFFNEKIMFSSLETLKLFKIGMTKLWDWPDEKETNAKKLGTDKLRNKKLYYSSFRKLKIIDIQVCDKLECLFSPCDVAAFERLENLETLIVERCSQMLNVITNNVADAIDIPDHPVIVFSNLKLLKLENLPRVRNFYGGNSTSFFNEKVRFPCLEELELNSVTDYVDKIWDMDSLSTGLGNPAPSLKVLYIVQSYDEFAPESMIQLIQVPYIVLENLSSLGLNRLDIKVSMQSSNGLQTATLKPIRDCMRQFERLKELSLSEVHWKYVCWVDDRHGREVILMPLLENLEIWFGSLEVVVGGTGGDNHEELDNRRQTAISIVFPRLRKIFLIELSNACHFSQITSSFHFPSLIDLSIWSCEEMQSFLPTGRFIAPSLQNIYLSDNPKLEWLFPCDEHEYVQELPSLKSLTVSNCPKFRALSLGPLRCPSNIDIYVDFENVDINNVASTEVPKDNDKSFVLISTEGQGQILKKVEDNVSASTDI